MIDLIYRMLIPLGCSKFGYAWNRLLLNIGAYLYPLLCRLHPLTEKNNLSLNENVIVSLTSFPDRINGVEMCVQSLLRQSQKPDRVILWLAENQFRDQRIPSKLQALTKYGFEIRFCSEDLKPHKKWYYTAREYSDSIIITVDDDIIYSSRLVERLLAAHREDMNSVLCCNAHRIKLNQYGEIARYADWDAGAKDFQGPSHYLLAVGAGGVLYPPHTFDDVFFDIDAIRATSLFTDDLWLKFNEIRRSIPVKKIIARSKQPMSIPGSQKVALKKNNTGRTGRNDESIECLQQMFLFDWNELTD